ncbi:hypothetical protein Pla123a_18920 [Posidoniimonas polymericola]|uniref:PEP-CTERM protein-sorting domain-containing protein n=1 Tax=Posidoniimonas polymericola TaxID=2528002 RepID=A0A5C5YR69_9BACT|nr:hypothetical protein [Posidoniimonas polymericola]TWT77237.1 hypothetical protein Pla123a_18920 [Posidoniimonas polymericola]
MRRFHLQHAVACVLAAAVAAGSSTAYGHGGGGDIALFATDGQADLGFAILDDDDDLQVVFDPDENVFLSVLLPQAPNPVVPWDFGSPEPGLDANEGSLPPSAEIVMNLIELQYWNGAGPMSFSSLTGVSGGVAPQPLQSFPDGGFHSHPLFGVEGAGAAPPAGVYVGKLTVSVEGLSDSDPYYMVSLISDSVTAITDEDHRIEAAEAIGALVRNYAADPLASPTPVYEGVDFTYYAEAVMHVRGMASVPEPASGVLVALCLAFGAAARVQRSSF